MTGSEPVAAENVCCGCVRVKFFLCVLLTLALSTNWPLHTRETRVCIIATPICMCGPAVFAN